MTHSPRLRAFILAAAFLAAGRPVHAGHAEDSIKAYRNATIAQVMKRIASEHYQPKPVNDAFSATIWEKFLTQQDPGKLNFMQADIDRLRAWELRLDDELQTPSSEFFHMANAMLIVRMKESVELFDRLLAKPLDFSRNDVYVEKPARYPAGHKEREQAWVRFLKRHVLHNMAEMMAADPTLKKADAEKAARKKVHGWLRDSYKNLLGVTAPEQRFATFLNVVVMEIDPHTNFFAPVDSKERDARNAQRYFGVGMELSAEDGEIRVKRILPGGAADRSGLMRANDHITGVSGADGKMIPVSGLSVVDVSRMVRGDSGTVLTFLVKRAGLEEEVKLTRQEIKDASNAPKGAFIEKDGKTFGYIKLPEFYRDFSRPDGAQSGVDMAKEVLRLKEGNISGLIIDLRGNGGGSLEQVQLMMGFFVPSGPVAQGRFKDKMQRFDMNQFSDVMYDGPLTVLIDEASASASEMFSGAMQDYGRAVIIGSASSYGKGTMQETRPMGKLGNKKLGTPNISYGSVAITLGKFYRITGVTTQLQGIAPDVVVPGKGAWNILREKHFQTALQPDTIDGLYFRKWKDAGRLTAAIEKAARRVAEDTAFAGMRTSVNWLIAHQQDARPLRYADFMKAESEKLAHERRADQAAKLPASAWLRVKPSNTDPAAYAAETARREEWKNALQADRYVLHAVEVLKDLAR